MPYVKESMVYQREQSKTDTMLCAKIVYDKELIEEKFGKKKEEEYKNLIWEEIKEINKQLPVFKHIKKIDITEEELELYGKYKAKISKEVNAKLQNKQNGKLVLVTAMSPTTLGEGKTTMSIAIADGLRKIGKNSILALREPSLRTSFWNKRRSNRRRKSTNSSYGRY